MYREVLLDSQPERTLFLAIDEETFDIEFSDNLKKLVCERLKIKVLIFNVETEEVERWLT